MTVGKYRLEGVLGSGGMGVVWRAVDPDLERAVAIKLLHAGGTEPTLRSRLLREARAMARLKHPNVLTVYEVGTDANRDYIAMELVDGDTLEGWLATKPPRPAIVAALLAAGRGLAAAHAAGLVHRDFKPHNVLRSRDGHVYVTDFGLARGQIEDGDVEQLPTSRARDAVLDTPLTQTGVLIGTPAYMAPEQFAGRVPDPRSDQFAFCVTAWEALTGARPFRGSTLAELEAASSRGAPTTGVATTEMPAAIRGVLARGLDPDPAKRWPDMMALLAALSEAAAPGRARLPRTAIVAVSAVAIGGAIGIVALSSAGSDAPTPTASRPVVARSRSACDDPGRAFDSAWSSTQRSALVDSPRGPTGIAAMAILDDVRRQWVASYRASCASPRTPEIRERLACLDSLRERVAFTVQRMLRERIDMQSLGILGASIMMCDPSARPFGERGERELEDATRRSLPVPPVPPMPPGAPP